MGTSQHVSHTILVLVGPPGVGKKFCTLRLNGNHPMDVEIIKTITTQPHRQIYDSLFYITHSLEEFQQRVAVDDLLEHDEFAGHQYGIERQGVEAILTQKHGVVSATPAGADVLRRCGLPTVTAYLIPTSKTLLEDNLRKKNEDPDRIARMRKEGGMFDGLPESAFDVVVRVKSLVEAAQELDEKLRAYMTLR